MTWEAASKAGEGLFVIVLATLTPPRGSSSPQNLISPIKNPSQMQDIYGFFQARVIVTRKFTVTA